LRKAEEEAKEAADLVKRSKVELKKIQQRYKNGREAE